MDIIKIIGIGLIALIIIIILKQYKPEFAVYVSILARDFYTYTLFITNIRSNKPFKRYIK